MSDTLCLYNGSHGCFHRRELRMLAQALGLPEERLGRTLDKLGMGETIPVRVLLDLIDHGTFLVDFHRAFNNQSGRYNSLVLAKGLQLIDARLFNFNEMLQARLAFNLYEIRALRNDDNSLESILKTIKFCHYRISPLKLEQRLRHLFSKNKQVLHFCEYLDLLLISVREHPTADSSSSKVIDLLDPTPIEDKRTEELNLNYLRDEHNWCTDTQYLKGQIHESAVWPAKMEHQSQIDAAANERARLQQELASGLTLLKQSRAGRACSSHSRSSSATPHRSPLITHRASTPAVLPVIKTNDIANRLAELQCESTFLAFKYAVRREDYMNELFPNGYTPPVIIARKLPAASVI